LCLLFFFLCCLFVFSRDFFSDSFFFFFVIFFSFSYFFLNFLSACILFLIISDSYDRQRADSIVSWDLHQHRRKTLSVCFVGWEDYVIVVLFSQCWI
jgi:hypothetical protein